MIQVYDKYGKIKSSGIPGFGTVTAVSAGNLSPLFTTVVTSPTSTPNIAFTLTSQTQKLFFASPNSGSGTPTFRAIQASDLPSLSGTYVPVTRNLTINGVTYDLSSDRSWTVAASAVWGNITGTITDQTDLINYLSTNYYPTSNPNGYISQESVLEYADISAFPIVGASNTIYIALDTGIGYFWDGTAYSVLSTSTSGISGFGIVNRLAKFSPNGSSIASSKITESLFGDVKLNDSNRPYIAGNTILSIQRAQTQLDFVLGNPLTSQISRMISDNNIGLSIESKNYLSFATGPSYTESFRLLSSGKLQITQTPNAGTISDSILVRDSLGEVKTISYPTLTGFVPYTGATSNVDLGEWQLKSGQVEFDQTPTGTSGVAKLRWNDTDGTLDLGLKGGNVTLQIGQEEVIRVVNKSGINLLESNYQVTRIRNVAEGGAQGQRLAIVLAQANTKVNHTGVLGLVTENINDNQEGFITTFGMVRDINTTGSIQGETWVDGDVLWLSETVAGGLTNIEPNTHPVQIGYVVYAHANNGKIFVSVSGGADELNELHDVTISSPVNNNILSYNSSLQRWENKTISEIDGLSLQSGVSNLEYISNLIHKQNLGWMQPNNGNATYNFLKSSTNINLSGGSGTNAIPARLVYETAATAGGVCFARGLSGGSFSAASTGSFWWSRKFEITSNVANSRFVCALSNQFRLSNPTNVEPTTLINLIGVCKLSTSDNLHFIWNDATGTASTLDLGTNFPANNTTAYTYIFEIYKIFDSTDIVLKLSRIDVNGNVLTTQHTINSDIPALIISAVIFGTNNTTASVFSFNDFGTVFKNYERQWDII